MNFRKILAGLLALTMIGSVAGIPALAADELAETAVFGDLNGDGYVMINDADYLLEHMALNREYREDYDMNCDGVISAGDYGMMVSYINESIFYLPMDAADEEWLTNYADYDCTFTADACQAYNTWEYATTYFYPSAIRWAMGDVMAFRVVLDEASDMSIMDVYADGLSSLTATYPVSDREIFVLVYHMKDHNETDLEVEQLNVTVARGTDIYTASSAEVQITEAYISNIYGQTADIQTSSSTITFHASGEEELPFGDLNYDGIVDESDAYSILPVMADPETSYDFNCDMNQDGLVNASDFAMLLQYGRGNIPYLPYRFNDEYWTMNYESFENNLLTEDLTTDPLDTTGIVNFVPENYGSLAVSDLLVFDLEVSSEAGLTFEDIMVSGDNFETATCHLSDNKVKVIIYNPSVSFDPNQIYSSDNYSIINSLEVLVNRNDEVYTAAEGEVSISNVSVCNIFGQSIELADAAAKLTFPSAEGYVPEIGDLYVDGGVGYDDAEVLLAYIASEGEAGGYEEKYDMNGDDKVNAADYAALVHYIEGSISELPAENGETGWAENYAGFDGTAEMPDHTADEMVDTAYMNVSLQLPENAAADVFAFYVKSNGGTLVLDGAHAAGDGCSADVYAVSDTESYVVVTNNSGLGTLTGSIDLEIYAVNTGSYADPAEGIVEITGAYLGNAYGETIPVEDVSAKAVFPGYAVTTEATTESTEAETTETTAESADTAETTVTEESTGSVSDATTAETADTESSETVTTPSEDDSDAQLPQTGYPRWIGLLLAGAAVLTTAGGLMIKSGIRKDENDKDNPLS